MSNGKIFVYDNGSDNKRPEQYRTYREDGTRGDDFLWGDGIFSRKKPLEIGANDTLVLQSKTEGAHGALAIHRNSPTEGFKLSLPDYLAKDAQIRVGSISFDEKTKQVKYQIYVMDSAEIAKEGQHTGDKRSRITLEITDDFSKNPELFAQAKKGVFEEKGADGKIIQKPFNILSNVSVFGSPRDPETGQIQRDQVGTFTASTDAIGYSELLQRQKQQAKNAGRAVADGDAGAYDQFATVPVASRALSDYQKMLANEQAPAPDERYSPYWHEVLEKQKTRELITSREEIQVAVRDSSTTEVTGTERRLVNGMMMEVPVTKTINTPGDSTGTKDVATLKTPEQIAEAKERFNAFVGAMGGEGEEKFKRALERLAEVGPGRVASLDPHKFGDKDYAVLADLMADYKRLRPNSTAMAQAEKTLEANKAAQAPEGYAFKDNGVYDAQGNIVQDERYAPLQEKALAVAKALHHGKLPAGLEAKLSDNKPGPETIKYLNEALQLSGDAGLIAAFAAHGPDALLQADNLAKFETLTKDGSDVMLSAAKEGNRRHKDAQEAYAKAHPKKETKPDAVAPKVEEPATIAGLSEDAKKAALNFGAAANIPTFTDFDGKQKVALSAEDRMKSIQQNFQKTMKGAEVKEFASNQETRTPDVSRELVAANKSVGPNL